MRRFLLLYLVILLGCGWGIYETLQAGKRLESTRTIVPAVTHSDSAAPAATHPGLFQNVRENLRDPLSLLLVQLILIILLARIFGAIFVRFGQPAVIGEMIAGIVLGPSVVGTFFPGASAFLFPASSFGVLRMLSQVGVILFMFVVGMELDLRQLRRRASTAVMVSHASIVIPYFLGVLFSLHLYQKYASHQATFTAFALFMGIAMSITAFPVLARILDERGLSRSSLGSVALTSAAVDDVSAWTILAFVVAFVKAGSAAGSMLTIVLLLAFVTAMLLGARPMLRRFLDSGPPHASGPGHGTVVGILIMVFASGLVTELIGVHALFGAFLVGVMMPPDYEYRQQLRERLESFSSAFLLPLFFAFTGLRTQVGLLNDWESVTVCLALIGVATLGKLGGSMLIARFTGMGWHDSFALGVLMNTRGLVELIVLNIGLDLGILSPHAGPGLSIEAKPVRRGP